MSRPRNKAVGTPYTTVHRCAPLWVGNLCVDCIGKLEKHCSPIKIDPWMPCIYHHTMPAHRCIIVPDIGVDDSRSLALLPTPRRGKGRWSTRQIQSFKACWFVGLLPCCLGIIVKTLRHSAVRMYHTPPPRPVKLGQGFVCAGLCSKPPASEP